MPGRRRSAPSLFTAREVEFGLPRLCFRAERPGQRPKPEIVIWPERSERDRPALNAMPAPWIGRQEWAGDRAAPSRALGLHAERGSAHHAPGARRRHRRRGRDQRGRRDPRAQGEHRLRSRRASPVAFHRHAALLLDPRAGPVSPPKHRADQRRRLHEHRAHRAVSRIGTPGGRLRDRARGRRGGAGHRARSDRDPPARPHPADAFPYRTVLGVAYDSGDYGRALDRWRTIRRCVDSRRKRVPSGRSWESAWRRTPTGSA